MILKIKSTSDHYNHMNQLIQKKKKKLMTKDLAKEP